MTPVSQNFDLMDSQELQFIILKYAVICSNLSSLETIRSKCWSLQKNSGKLYKMLSKIYILQRIVRYFHKQLYFA